MLPSTSRPRRGEQVDTAHGGTSEPMSRTRGVAAPVKQLRQDGNEGVDARDALWRLGTDVRRSLMQGSHWRG